MTLRPMRFTRIVHHMRRKDRPFDRNCAIEGVSRACNETANKSHRYKRRSEEPHAPKDMLGHFIRYRQTADHRRAQVVNTVTGPVPLKAGCFFPVNRLTTDTGGTAILTCPVLNPLLTRWITKTESETEHSSDLVPLLVS